MKVKQPSPAADKSPTQPAAPPPGQPASLRPDIGHIALVRHSIEDLKPADYNPRTMSDRARAGLSSSIDAFGLVQPVIWNRRTGHVVGGHQRLYDLIAKGAIDTDVVEVDIPEIKEKALNIALNHSGISGDFDQEKLDSLLQEVGDMDPEIISSLNLDELRLPDFSSVEHHLGDGEGEEPLRKIMVVPQDGSVFDEMKTLISQVLSDHYTPKQFKVMDR